LSEPKLISPLLDGFVMGNAMSDHDGIQCFPAMKEGSEEKYIVKVISIPASQVQLDALLLTGAYKDPADAMDYFKSVADGVLHEVDVLQQLSRLDGFLAYEGCQVVPMEGGRLGNQIYLLGSYKRSLERHMRRSQMTHLEAVNLGLDLCQALAICRRAGWMYVDLKPSNVFISRNKEYRIGDLGFVDLNSLKYSSLPGNYLSAYSPPETKDAMKTLNTTVDTYSAGMILYQVFNDGQLPAPLKDPTKPYLPPVNADYEISGIIMKAIAPNPEDRWGDPMEMGQALVGYMQRNSINNTPLTPTAEIVTDPEAPALVREAALQTKVLPNLKDIPPQAQEPSVSSETMIIPEPVNVPAPVSIPEPEPIPETVPVQKEEPASPAVQEDAPAPMNREEAIAAQISSLFPEEEANDPAGSTAVAVAEMPDPPVFDEDDGFSLEGILDDDGINEEDYPEDPLMEDDIEPRRKRKSISKKIIVGVVTIMLLALMACGGMWYYQNMYLQHINGLEVVSSLDQVTVTVDTTMDESLLSVTCTDTYGNSQRQNVANGQAVFTGLLPNSQYKINLEVSGFHKLSGKLSEVFNTAAQSNVVSFTAIAGPEDGSVLLNLVIDGTDPESWTLVYGAEGVEEQTVTFNGHSVTIKGLAVGKEYTFTLQNPEASVLTGETSVTFTSTELVMAENLTIVSCSNGNLTVRWDVPEGLQVDTWTVRCYNDADFDQVQENVVGTETTFTEVDTTRAYTVEVTASGMTQPIRTSITSNPITISSITVDEEDPSEISVSWQHEGKAPVGGWLLMYRLDNAEKANVVKCDEAGTVISPRIPNATYHFEIQAADSTSIFSNVHQFTTASAEMFDFEGVTGEKILPHLLKTPAEQDWTYESIDNDDFTDTFSSGDPISVVLQGTVGFYIPDADINAMYVIRDAEGNVRYDLVTQETLNWKDLWYDGDPRYGELDLPVAPAEAGSYTVEIYFNDFALTSADFTIE